MQVGQIMHPAKHFPLLPTVARVTDLQRREFSFYDKHQRPSSAVRRLHTLQSPIRTDTSCCELASEELNRVHCEGKTTGQPWTSHLRELPTTSLLNEIEAPLLGTLLEFHSPVDLAKLARLEEAREDETTTLLEDLERMDQAAPFACSIFCLQQYSRFR